MSDTGSGKQLLRGHSFAMERMMAKDEEDRLERVNTKQKRGTPTVCGSSEQKFPPPLSWGTTGSGSECRIESTKWVIFWEGQI